MPQNPSPSLNTPSLNIVPQAACRHLLSKGMFVTGLLDPADHPTMPMDDGYCWCNLTQSQLGPDDQLVERATCHNGRECYEAR